MCHTFDEYDKTRGTLLTFQNMYTIQSPSIVKFRIFCIHRATNNLHLLVVCATMQNGREPTVSNTCSYMLQSMCPPAQAFLLCQLSTWERNYSSIESVKASELFMKCLKPSWYNQQRISRVLYTLSVPKTNIFQSLS